MSVGKIRRVLRLFVPYTGQQAIIVLTMLAGAVLGLAPGIVTAHIIDSVLPKRDVPGLIVHVAIIIACGLVVSAIQLVQGYFTARVGQGIVRDIRVALVTRLHRAPLSFFAGVKLGDILNRVNGDVDNVDMVLTGTLSSVIGNVISIAVTLCAMFIWDWRLACTALVIVPLMILPLGRAGGKMYDIRAESRVKRDEMLALTQETLSISGISLVKSFGREKYESARFNKSASDVMALEIALTMASRWYIAFLSATAYAGPALVWLGGGLIATFWGLKIGVIVAFISFIQGRLYGSAAEIARVHTQIWSGFAVFDRIFAYLDMPSEEYDCGESTGSPTRGQIVFQDVSFAYADGHEVLKDVSFAVNPGEVAAFVGPSGAGKTTLCQLVLRFYDPGRGAILFDGRDLRKLDLEGLRSCIGVVSQETYLFHDTIRNNLRYARAEATDLEIADAVRAANLQDVVAKLPDGLETIVGDRGYKLSGGERQRLAIARVLLRNPPVLIFDEATSALDSESEQAIQAALITAMAGRTSFVVAHRLSTIANADRIFVVEGGRIVESGSHSELVSKGGLYNRLYSTQLRRLSA